MTAPAGILVARWIAASFIAKNDALSREAYVEGRRQYFDTPHLATCSKAAVTAISSADLQAALRPIARDLAEFLRPRTIIGRLQLRRIPFRVRMVQATSGIRGAWTGVGAPIPISKMTLEGSGDQLSPLTVAGAGVFSSELARNSNPAAESVIVRDSSAGLTYEMDLAFIDPQNAGTVDEKPASIAYGASSFESRGSDIGAIDADLADMLAVLTNGNLDLAAAAWIMAPATAVSLSLKRGADGARSYPEVTAKGGSLLGVPIVTSNACTATGSPGERHILLVQADEVLIADDGEGTVEVTEHAAVQMDDAPAGGEQQLVSLWQNGLVGVKAKRYLSWRRRRDEAVAILRSVQY